MMQSVLVQATSLGKGQWTCGGNVMLDAVGRVRGRNFSGEHRRIGGEERVKLKRTSLERGKQWRGISSGSQKQRLEGRGEHQQGGDEQPGNLHLGWEERQEPKGKERKKHNDQNGQNYCGFPKWGEECHQRCGGAGRKAEPVTGGAGGCSWSQNPSGSPGKKWSPAGG